MSRYVEKDVTPLAIEHLRKSLEWGWTLSRCLLDQVDLSRGRITSLLPDHISESAVRLFTNGGIIDPATSESWLVTIVRSFLGGVPTGLAIFQDFLARPGDPCLRGKSSHLWSFSDEVYYVLFHADADEATIGQALRWADSLPLFVAVLAMRPPYTPFETLNKKLSLEVITEIARGTKKIILGAYDGEGYIIWHIAEEYAPHE